MRPLALEPRHIRGLLRDLEAAGDDLAAAVDRVEVPERGYPWGGLVERGVAALLRDATDLRGACRGLAGRLEDSLLDFEELDAHVADAAGVRP